MERLNLTASLGLSMVAALPMVAFADVGVPSAARMIHEAGLIVVGTAATGGGTPSFVPSRVLKGSTGGLPALALIDPSGGRFLTFSLARIPEIVGTAPTLAFGRVDPQRATLSLTWLNASLWPQGHRYDTFDSGTLEASVAFVERVLGYSALAARDPDAAVRTLVADIAANRTQAPLTYLEVAVQADFGPPAAALVRAVCAVALSRVALDAPSVRQFADIAPVFPVTLIALPLASLADLAAGEDGTRVRQAVQSMLSARGSKLAPGANTTQLRSAYAGLAATLRRADAKRLLAVFDSPLPSLRDGFADALMAELLGARPPEALAGMPAPQRKAIWRREIDALPD